MKNASRIGYTDLLLSFLLGAGVWTWFAVFYRFHLHYQEEMQLFLFTPHYFAATVSQPGGLARWIGEFLTQFGIDSFLGASAIALLLVQMHWQLLSLALRLSNRPFHWTTGLFTLVPPLLFAGLLCNENVLLSGVVSVCLVLGAAQTVASLRSNTLKIVGVCLLLPLLWWVTGLPFDTHTRYPLQPFYPYTLAVALTLLIPPADCLLHRAGRTTATLLRITLPAISLWIGFSLFVDRDKEEVMAYSYFAQTGNWNRIVSMARRTPPNGPLTVSTLNMALCQTGQMPERMFQTYQNGPEGLIPSFVKEYLPCQMTGEIYFRLGLIGSAQRLAFEGMEAIPDQRKSVRAIKRLAETNLIGGHYAVAAKYIHLLKQTLFYRSWAVEMESYLYNDDKVNRHPLYGKLREMSPKEDFLFSEQEKEMMLGLLFQQNTTHREAFEYLLAHCLLSNDLKRFGEYFRYGSQYLRYDPLPASYRNAWSALKNNP